MHVCLSLGRSAGLGKSWFVSILKALRLISLSLFVLVSLLVTFFLLLILVFILLLLVLLVAALLLFMWFLIVATLVAGFVCGVCHG